jgi:hypothetical protein
MPDSTLKEVTREMTLEELREYLRWLEEEWVPGFVAPTDRPNLTLIQGGDDA